jgi:hypothetical protein
MDRPEYLVVRVYRRELGEPWRIEGIVEVVATGEQFTFTNAQELWAILLHPPPAAHRRRSKPTG